MRLLILTSLLFSFSALAVKPVHKGVEKKAPECAEESDQARSLASDVMTAVTSIKGCPNFSKLNGLCDVINAKLPDSGPYQYLYERKIYEAACADPSKDSPEVVNQKVQVMWKTFEDKLTCNTSSFEIPNGNVLKYAMSMRVYEFLDDAIKKWNIDLNRVDPVDGKTLLDYVMFLQSRYKGTPDELMINVYYKRLIKAGAKSKEQVLAEINNKNKDA